MLYFGARVLAFTPSWCEQSFSKFLNYKTIFFMSSWSFEKYGFSLDELQAFRIVLDEIPNWGQMSYSFVLMNYTEMFLMSFPVEAT